MKRFLILSLLFVLFSCKQKLMVVEDSVVVNEIETYVNEIEKFIHHINISTKDNDSINLSEFKLVKNAHKITLSVSDKKVFYRNKKIVKAKYKDYLENNFVKVKSFYYDNDNLVCVRIYELIPTEDKKIGVFKKVLYYKENKLLLDSNESDYKYQNEDLLSFGIEKLEEEYQSKNQ